MWHTRLINTSWYNESRNILYFLIERCKILKRLSKNPFFRIEKLLREIANDLRQIVHKVDKIATKQASDKFEALNVVLVGKKHPWQNHPQKEKIYKLVRTMHKVGANLSMISSGLNLEGLKNSTGDGEWKVTDVKKMGAEIKRESDYLPPIYSLPDKP